MEKALKGAGVEWLIIETNSSIWQGESCTNPAWNTYSRSANGGGGGSSVKVGRYNHKMDSEVGAGGGGGGYGSRKPR